MGAGGVKAPNHGDESEEKEETASHRSLIISI